MDTSLVYFSISDLKIVTARHLLTEAGIESFTLNKKDSMHVGLFGGKVELYVGIDRQEEAKKILQESGVLDD